MRDVRTGAFLGGGWTDATGRRRPLIAGSWRNALVFEDEAAAERAASYLNASDRRGSWVVDPVADGDA